MNFWLVFVLLGFCVFALVVLDKANLTSLIVLSDGSVVEKPEQNYANCNLNETLCLQYQKLQAERLIQNNEVKK